MEDEESPLVNWLALPIAFVIAEVIRNLSFLNVLAWYFFSIPVHEFGHAGAAWLSSRYAVPIGAFIPMAAFTAVGSTRWTPLFLIFATALILLGWRAWLELKIAALALSLTLLCALIYWTWIAPMESAREFFTFAGIAGEFVIGAGLVIFFYYPLPAFLRWDFFRFPLLLIGMYVFVSAASLWSQIAEHRHGMPIGSFLNGSGDGGGDIDRLLGEFHLAVPDLIARYQRLGSWGIRLILLNYVIFALKAWLIRPPLPPLSAPVAPHEPIPKNRLDFR